MISTHLSIHGCNGHTVVTLRGELDLADAPYVAAVLMAVADREPEIVADLTGLEFIDSSGLAALERGREQARQAGGDLLLAAPQRQVIRLLAITRLARDFSVYASVEDAASTIRTLGTPGGGSCWRCGLCRPRPRPRRLAHDSVNRRQRARRGPA
jgi:anti-sigma B factor antagonist